MSYLGLHLQSPVNNWNLEVKRAYDAGSPYAVIKSFHPENYLEVQAAAPGTPFVYRYWNDAMQQTVILPMIYEGRYNEAADLWISQSKDSINQYMGTTPNRPVYFESMNEEYPTHNLAKLRAVVQFDIAFCKRLSMHCPGVRPAVFTAAIGNPDHNEAAELLPLAIECQKYNGVMCYHMYHSVYFGNSFVNSLPHQEDLHMRWALSFDVYFRQHGVKVDWMLSEAGAIGSEENGYGPKPLDGWKMDRVWNDSIENYITDLGKLDSLVAASIPARDGKLVGLTLFTSHPDPGNWRYFNIKDADLFRLTDYVMTHPHPTPVPPPVPTSRVLGLDVSRWQGNMDFSVAYNRGARFVYVKSTEGVSWVDPRYHENVVNAKANNVFPGPYHFYLSDEEPIEQKDHFLNITGVTSVLPHMLDVEDPPGVTFGEVEGEEDVDGFLGAAAYVNYAELLELTGEGFDYLGEDVRLCLEEIGGETDRRPVIYTNKYFYDAYLANADLNEVADLHIAQWTTAQNPTIPSDWSTWTFWQYSNNGIGPEWGAQSDRIDLNYFNGDLEDLLAYISEPPPPEPDPDNIFRNYSFENGHHVHVHPNGTVYNNILVPNEWWFRFAGTNVVNEYSPDPVNIYQQPEMLPLHRNQLPPDEWDDFILDGNYTLKLFAGYRAWRTKLVQTLSEPVSNVRMTVHVFPDCYTAVVNGQKVWATDPNTCLVVPEVNGVEYGDRIQIAPGMMHELAWDIATENIQTIGLKVFGPFATMNNGVFMDYFELNEVVPWPPFPVYASTISLMPPKNTYTEKEREAIFAFVEERRETLAYSPHDCVKVGISGLPGTVRVWYRNRWPFDIAALLNWYGIANVEFWPR